MPRKALIKVGDRVSRKNSNKEIFGVVVAKKSEEVSNVHWDVKVDKLCIRSVRASRTLENDTNLLKAKPVTKLEVVEEEND